MVPGHIENRLLIVDCKDLWVWSIPTAIIRFKNIIGAVSLQKQCKDRSIYVLNAPYTFWALWNIIKKFIHACTAEKIKITSYNTCDELKNMVHPNQLEKRYGGSAPDRQNDYWPPKFSCEEFGEYEPSEGPDSKVVEGTTTAATEQTDNNVHEWENKMKQQHANDLPPENETVDVEENK